MERVSVWYLRTGWRSIRNRTNERSERVRFQIQTNECVNTIRTHFPRRIICILRFESLLNKNLSLHRFKSKAHKRCKLCKWRILHGW